MRRRSAMNKRRTTPASASASTAFRLSYRRPISMLLLLMFSGVTLLLLSTLFWHRNAPLPTPPQISTISVLNEFPHDPHAFTQGLVYGGNDTLYESTGLYSQKLFPNFSSNLTQSSVRRVALRTGKLEMLHKMDSSQFGEGLTLLEDRLYQVTWLTKRGFIYDKKNLSKNSLHIQCKIGLATNGNILFGSDGSSTLYQMDSKTLKVMKNHVVTYNGHEVHNLKELEFVNGEVWANVWMTDCIARISPSDGKFVGWILLQNLRENMISSGKRDFGVLNGIAWDDANNRIFVTGKLWLNLYEIKFHPVERTFEGSIEQLCLLIPFHFH